MSDLFSDYGLPKTGWSNWPPQIRAALIFTIPFAAVDFFNYYSAGIAFAISCPALFLLYAGCGVFAARFAMPGGMASSNFLFVGATAGAGLWLISTMVNAVIALILGTASLGSTLLLGIPYILCCAPLSLVMGASVGAAGALVYSTIVGKSHIDGF